jgi:uncharacterized protein YjiS (DUF1127 family)
MTDQCLGLTGSLRSPRAAGGGRFSRLAGQFHRLAGRAPRWTRAEDGRRALAEVDDDHLSDLSEIGRQVRREERQRALP